MNTEPTEKKSNSTNTCAKESLSDLKRKGLEKRSADLKTPANVTPALISHLANRFPPEVIANKIAELLEATHKTKGGQDIADNRAREAGLKLLMSYLIGLPVQRQEVVQVNFDSLEQLQERARQSPALRSALTKILEPSPTDIQIDPLPKNEQGEDCSK